LTSSSDTIINQGMVSAAQDHMQAHLEVGRCRWLNFTNWKPPRCEVCGNAATSVTAHHMMSAHYNSLQFADQSFKHVSNGSAHLLFA
jgi:hypothetical protein